MTSLFELPVPSLPIQGNDHSFPVGRIFCVGQNYEAHAREMGAVKRSPPFFFAKPAQALLTENGRIPYPPRTEDLHHEVELVVALDRGGRNLDPEQAAEAVYAYGVGVDFTRRDVQAESKKKGRPWDTAKGFEHSAPVSALVPRSATGRLTGGAISLAVNGETRQQGDLQDMIWNVEEIIAELSTWFCLQAGDLIFTGTPAGVSAVVPGDELLARIEPVGELSLRISG